MVLEKQELVGGNNMRLCVLGGTGQLGYEIKKRFINEEVISLGKQDFDISNMEETYQSLKEIRPEFIIHAAAFTNVDRCEERQEIAYQVNAQGTENVAKAAEALKSKLIYISSDYVFDGEKGRPYHEDDIPNPINVYGKSKYMGEEAVKRYTGEYYIVRTAWLYGFKGNNFVKTILRLTNDNTIIKVVNDQRGCPTFAYDLGMGLRSLIDGESEYGIYHLTNEDNCTWYDFAEKICQYRKLQAKILPITTEEIYRKAPRPKNSSLENNSPIKLRHWEEALYAFLKEYH